MADQALGAQFSRICREQGRCRGIALRVPAAEIYAIDVSFAALKDKKELEYLNLQPTTFVLEPEAVDRLRAAGGTIILESPEFNRLLKDIGATLVAQPAATASPARAQ